jgi:hypothetical protein
MVFTSITSGYQELVQYLGALKTTLQKPSEVEFFKIAEADYNKQTSKLESARSWARVLTKYTRIMGK